MANGLSAKLDRLTAEATNLAGKRFLQRLMTEEPGLLFIHGSLAGQGILAPLSPEEERAGELYYQGLTAEAAETNQEVESMPTEQLVRIVAAVEWMYFKEAAPYFARPGAEKRFWTYARLRLDEPHASDDSIKAMLERELEERK